MLSVTMSLNVLIATPAAGCQVATGDAVPTQMQYAVVMDFIVAQLDTHVIPGHKDVTNVMDQPPNFAK